MLEPTLPGAASLAIASSPVADPLVVLIQAMAGGDECALSSLHRACGARMRACALSIVRRSEIAEEVVSASFLQAWLSAGRFNASRGTPSGWLLVITRSRALDALRQEVGRSRHEELLGEDALDLCVDVDAAGPDAVVERARRARGLHAMLGQLRQGQRQAISLAFIQGLTHEEVASHMGLPLGTTKSQIQRGMTALRTRCEAAGMSP
jgi:RNA polymerase sigma-70 factor (ECF subfamily)